MKIPRTFCRQLILISLLGITWVLQAQPNLLEKITINEGLSQGMIYDICQSSDGFLWVATKDGLNRYDGYNFKIYNYSPFDSFSVAENTITKLFEDSRGWLWLGLETKGIDVFDPKTGLFHHFPVNLGDIRIFQGSNTNQILETPDGAIWLAQSRGGILKLPIPESWEKALPEVADLHYLLPPELITLPFEAPLPNNPTLETIISFDYLSNGQLLVTSDRAQYYIDTKTKAATRSQELDIQPTMERFIIGDPQWDGDRWFQQFNPEKQTRALWRIRHRQLSIYPIPGEIQDRVRFMSGKSGHIWIVVGLRCWDISPGEDIDFNKPDLILDAPLACIQYDRNDNIWMGTTGYGLRKINSIRSKFHAGAAGRSVNGIWADKGRYFVKCAFAMSPYSPETDVLPTTSAFPNAPERQISLAFEPSGVIWMLTKIVGTTTGILLRFAPDNLAHAEKEYRFQANVTLYDPFLRARDGRLWIASDDARLTCFNPATEQFQTFDYGNLFGNKMNAVLPIALAEDGNGVIWLGTQMGLLKCTPNGQDVDFQLILANSNNKGGLNNNSIACLLPDPDDPAGILWIGTKGGGINILNTHTGQCRTITVADGLLNNVIYGILPGNHLGEFWCSTNRGLAKIVADSKEGPFKITTFTAALGLQDNEFNTYAYCKTEQGELLFGGVNGLNRFFPQELHLDTMPPPVYIVGLEINHQKADFRHTGSPLEAPLETAPPFDLAFDQNNISFEFAALDFTDPSKNRYRYRLSGLDADWVETGNYRFAHFNHLSPGRYTLRVQGSNGESAWREARPVEFVVHPPWYRSIYAYMVYMLLLARGAYAMYQFQIRRVRERDQLVFEQREKERIKVMEQMKTNFFSNITHEFRTPLTLILGPIQQLKSRISDPGMKESILIAEKNSRKLLGLVNQLLDMAKLESGHMVIDLRRGDYSQTVRSVFQSFLHLAEDRRVKLVMGQAPPLPEFMFDAQKIELIINNLLSNALKFTPEGGQVTLRILPLPKQVQASQAFVGIEVADTGIGIPADALSKVFDRFYQADSVLARAGEGTGIGLALSKELAERMGGSLEVASPDPGTGSGAVFRLRIPVIETRTQSAVVAGQEEALEANVMAPYQPERALTGETPLVLLVEDNLDMRRFIRGVIGETRWQFAEAANGEEGVKKALELLPDLVVSDVMMPFKDGYALCEELKNNELTAHIPIILLTAKSGKDAKIAGLRIGADDYIGKPFSEEELRARMENLLEQRRKLREIFAGKAPDQKVETFIQDRAPDGFLAQGDRVFLQKCYRLLDQYLDDERLGVEEFAQKLFISRVQLHRKIKATLDKTPIDFIREYRLECAMTMLKNREGNVAEVSRRVGFVNEKHFSTVFKAHFGVSPSEV